MEGLKTIHKNGQPYGIRYEGGYLLFFPKVSKYDGQEERYTKELKYSFELADKIIKALKE